MKRISKNKVYQLIGQATTKITAWALSVYATYGLAIYILDNCITVYR